MLVKLASKLANSSLLLLAGDTAQPEKDFLTFVKAPQSTGKLDLNLYDLRTITLVIVSEEEISTWTVRRD